LSKAEGFVSGFCGRGAQAARRKERVAVERLAQSAWRRA
jgi:hypothetical protein